ncbi:MAG: hypothetical protein IPH18_05990 [Chitinophagaceae bacterium]|nr:hypothetical protein [Chitinophagaceae bacterium]
MSFYEKIKLLSLLLFSFLLLQSCQKEASFNDDNNQQNFTVDANGNLSLSSDADGAFYAIKQLLYDSYSGNANDEFQYAMAWFGSPTSMKDGGDVTVNTFPVDFIAGVNYYVYVGFDDLYPTNTVAWTASGNSGNSIQPINHSDNTTFPQGGYFTLPAKINISNSFTLNYTATTVMLPVLYMRLSEIRDRNARLWLGIAVR